MWVRSLICHGCRADLFKSMIIAFFVIDFIWNRLLEHVEARREYPRQKQLLHLSSAGLIEGGSQNAITSCHFSACNRIT